MDIRPGLQGPLSPTEKLFSQGEKACWEEQLTQVGRGPGLPGLLGDNGVGGQGSQPTWMSTYLLSPRRESHILQVSEQAFSGEGA